jgi:hypothetical protein
MSGIHHAARWSFFMGCLLVLAASVAAGARSMTLPAVDAGYIVSDAPAPEGRILVRFEMPEELRQGMVEFAVLELRASVSSNDEVSCVVLDSFPLTTEWDGATVGWDGTWTSPGGDFDRSEHAVWIAQPGEDSLLRFDVTDMVRAWASGGLRNCGVVVAASGGAQGAVGPCDLHRAEVNVPVLKVQYTPHADEGG